MWSTTIFLRHVTNHQNTNKLSFRIKWLELYVYYVTFVEYHLVTRASTVAGQGKQHPWLLPSPCHFCSLSKDTYLLCFILCDQTLLGLLPYNCWCWFHFPTEPKKGRVIHTKGKISCPYRHFISIYRNDFTQDGKAKGVLRNTPKIAQQ